MKLRVHDGIGGVEIIIEDESPGVPQAISRFRVPSEIEGEVGVLLLRRALHNNRLEPNSRTFLVALVENFIGKVIREDVEHMEEEANG